MKIEDRRIGLLEALLVRKKDESFGQTTSAAASLRVTCRPLITEQSGKN